MIVMMEDYTIELEERLNAKSHNAMKVISDNIPVNMKVAADNKPSSGQPHANFIEHMVVMMLCVDSATAESCSNWSLVKVVREAAMPFTRDIIVVQDAKYSVIITTGPNASTSTTSPVAQLLIIARQITRKVHIAII